MYKKLLVSFKNAVRNNIIFFSLSPGMLYGYLNKAYSEHYYILLLILLLSLSLLKFLILSLLLYWEWVCCLWFGRVLILYFICFVIIIFLLFTPRVVQHVPYLWMMCTNNARFALLFYTRSIAGYVAVLSRCLSKIDSKSFVACTRSLAK